MAKIIKTLEVTQGDTLQTELVRPDGLAYDVLLNNTEYKCRVGVVDRFGATPFIDTNISLLNSESTHFQVYLPPSETVKLAKGEYFLIVEFTNVILNPPLSQEKVYKLIVNEDGLKPRIP